MDSCPYSSKPIPLVRRGGERIAPNVRPSVRPSFRPYLCLSAPSSLSLPNRFPDNLKPGSFSLIECRVTDPIYSKTHRIRNSTKTSDLYRRFLRCLSSSQQPVSIFCNLFIEETLLRLVSPNIRHLCSQQAHRINRPHKAQPMSYSGHYSVLDQQSKSSSPSPSPS